ncbi:dsRNA-binding IFN resistance/PKR inhibitor [Sea otter poxvirus]|uniref:DsRNA-binding IFN resistance/PKR inhibitor n=1 Tax=Sea otter poxvirus TaxID=1416741 RepID=A0A2U9QHM6_9POXV|nr:dsRNA-binding IFN resistance/PKR inhibitor [Sea otter poxvirus]AWU47072.1 dsRNA-binding IFN resistance/PKR inhibitor [Sea otter poxvirus]
MATSHTSVRDESCDADSYRKSIEDIMCKVFGVLLSEQHPMPAKAIANLLGISVKNANISLYCLERNLKVEKTRIHGVPAPVWSITTTCYDKIRRYLKTICQDHYDTPIDSLTNSKIEIGNMNFPIFNPFGDVIPDEKIRHLLTIPPGCAINEYCQLTHRKADNVICSGGTKSMPKFICTLYVDDILLAKAEGNNKRIAKEHASRDAIKILLTLPCEDGTEIFI